jgi:hypothetical protein
MLIHEEPNFPCINGLATGVQTPDLMWLPVEMEKWEVALFTGKVHHDLLNG